MSTDKELTSLAISLEQSRTVYRKHTSLTSHIEAITDFIRNSEFKCSRIRLLLATKSIILSHDSWWAGPLEIMLYQKPLDEMPLLINIPVYG